MIVCLTTHPLKNSYVVVVCFSQERIHGSKYPAKWPIAYYGLNSKKNANGIQRAEKSCLRFAIYDSRMIIENKDELYQDIIGNELR